MGNKPQYYVIGCRYSAKNDVSKDMQKKNCISTDRSIHLDISELYGQSQDQTERYFNKNSVGPYDKKVLRYMLNMKPGDMVAVKYYEQPSLNVIAYVKVIKRNRKLYFHDDYLGHCINVEYIKTGIKKRFEIGYKQTLSLVKNEEHKRKIFADYLTVGQTSSGKSTKKKSTTSYLRPGSPPSRVRRVHNKLQNAVHDHLCQEYGEDNVEMERKAGVKNKVDIILTQEEYVKYYEIKPYKSVKACIREALGQIIEYGWFNPTQREGKQLRLAIVGPEEPNRDEFSYIIFLQNNLKFPIEYLSFRQGHLISYDESD